MATTFAQTSFRHENKEVQREFERISKSPSKAVEKITAGQNTSVPSSSLPASDIEQIYTIFHNGNTINNYGINRSINFVDLGKDIAKWDSVEFSVSATNDGKIENAIVRGYYKSKRVYLERFFLTELDKSVSPSIAHGGYRYGQAMYKDIFHNFALTDLNKVIYSVYCVSEYTQIPIVIPKDVNTISVFGRVFIDDTMGGYIPCRNTVIKNNASGDEREWIGKNYNPEFIIVIEEQE